MKYVEAFETEDVTLDLQVRPAGRELSTIQLNKALSLSIGIQIFKNGRTAGATAGKATRVEASVQVAFGCRCGDQVTLRGRALTATGEQGPFARRGDSGALVIDKRARAVGGIIAVSEHSERYVAHITPWEVMKRGMMETLDSAGYKVADIEVL